MHRILLAIIGCLLATAVEAQGWGGGYVGASAGRFKAKSTWSTIQLGDPAVCPPGCLSDQDASLDASGWYWAAHVGYNVALGRVAFVGIEGGVGNANAKTTLDHVPGWTNDGMQVDRITATYEWNASVVGRAGITAGPVVLYGLAGPSWQKVSIRFTCPSDPVLGNSWCATAHQENRADVRRGWTAGGGAEFRLPARWSARLEYRYAKYEDKEYSFFGNSVDAVFARTTLKTNLIQLGVSYYF